MEQLTIKQIQGQGLYSPYTGQIVQTRGVVSAVVRRGFFIQMADEEWDQVVSQAIFVYSPDEVAWKGSLLEISGKAIDYIKHETAKPVTQIRLDQIREIRRQGPKIKPIRLTQRLLDRDIDQLSILLNSLEGMLVSIDSGQTFIAPSNRYGDYVLALDSDALDSSCCRSET